MQNVTNLQDLVLLLQVLCGEAQLHRLRHREQVFLSLVAISYSLDPSPAGLTIVLSHQEELISSPSIPRVFSQLFHRSQESPSLFQIYFTRCIQSPRQARKSHNLRQEPLSSFHLRRLPLFSAGTDLPQVDSSSLAPIYPPSMEMIVIRVFASPPEKWALQVWAAPTP